MKLIKYFRIICIAAISLVLQREACAALATTAWYTPIAKSVRMYASSYKTWRMVHPRLATSSDVLVLAGALIWVFNRFVKPPIHNLQASLTDNADAPSLCGSDDKRTDEPVCGLDVSSVPDGGDSFISEPTSRVFNPQSL